MSRSSGSDPVSRSSAASAHSPPTSSSPSPRWFAGLRFYHARTSANGPNRLFSPGGVAPSPCHLKSNILLRVANVDSARAHSKHKSFVSVPCEHIRGCAAVVESSANFHLLLTVKHTLDLIQLNFVTGSAVMVLFHTLVRSSCVSAPRTCRYRHILGYLRPT